MTRDLEAQWTRQIGANVRAERDRLGMSARELSEATAAQGYPVPRNTITNLENGRKQSVSVAEGVALAAGLGCPLADVLAWETDRLSADMAQTLVDLDSIRVEHTARRALRYIREILQRGDF